jgi:DNA-binding transcriptional MerR regulator
MLNIGEFARLGQVSPRMLRHYDEIDLLKPMWVDPSTAYRQYEIAQLGRLHRLLALRDLGFTLDRVRAVLDDGPSVERLKGMLLLRQVQLEDHVAEEQARLRRVRAHLTALEGSIPMSSLDVAIKTTEPVRVAEASSISPGFGSHNIRPVFERLAARVISQMGRTRARPGVAIAWYDEPDDDDGSVVVHVGFDVGQQEVSDGDGVRIVELPRVKVASLIHRGSMDHVIPVYEALARWVEESGNRLAGNNRELYHHWDKESPDGGVTEIQMPLLP